MRINDYSRVGGTPIEQAVQAVVSQRVSHDVPAPRTPLSKISSALGNANDLSDRICALVDDLIGSVPEDPTGARLQVGSSGVFPSLGDSADGTCERIDRAQTALNRLSAVLGL